MKERLEKKLSKKFPILYKYFEERTEPLTPMIFGFECEDGWYDIIFKLSEEIEKFNNQVKDEKEYECVQAFQVKEKFGGLRFYVNGAPEHIYKAIEKTEKTSYETCEECGKPGSMRTLRGFWLKTMCDKCFKKRDKK